MTTYYIDGFTVGANPAKHGGYTITDEHGNILRQKFAKCQNNRLLTNNYTEFLALYDCLAEFCADGDTIVTDSQNNLSWANLRFPRKSKRKDLLPMAREINAMVKKLGVKLEWVPRAQNLAGLANEKIMYNL